MKLDCNVEASAPLKLTDGETIMAPENHSFEFDGSASSYFVQSGVRYKADIDGRCNECGNGEIHSGTPYSTYDAFRRANRTYDRKIFNMNWAVEIAVLVTIIVVSVVVYHY